MAAIWQAMGGRAWVPALPPRLAWWAKRRPEDGDWFQRFLLDRFAWAGAAAEGWPAAVPVLQDAHHRGACLKDFEAPRQAVLHL
jgi:hypothetical protein